MPKKVRSNGHKSRTRERGPLMGRSVPSTRQLRRARERAEATRERKERVRARLAANPSLVRA